MFPFVVVVALLWLSGCSLPTRPCDLGNDSSGIPRCPLSASYVDQRPEAHLAYPGSTQLSRQETDEEVGLDANSDAGVTTTLIAQASPTTIRDWYVVALHQIGWPVPTLQPGPWTPVSGTSLYTTLELYRPPREGFSVNIELTTGQQTKYDYSYGITTGGWRG